MKHEIVIGMLLGDEGKGATVSYLSSLRKTDFIVKHSGGPQNAHNVIEKGYHHTFAQIGSGALHDVPTIISRFCLVNPLNLLKEASSLEEHLGYNPLHQTLVSEECRVITLLHRVVNQLREESRGAQAHGSCGQGLGEVMFYETSTDQEPLKMKDLRSLDADIIRAKIEEYLSWVEETFVERKNVLKRLQKVFNVDSVEDVVAQLLDTARDIHLVVKEEMIQKLIRKAEHLVFEGSQGILLDEWLGFHPHTTWSTTTDENAHTLLREAGVDPEKEAMTVGALRTYATRHGHGPFPSENIEESVMTAYPENHNKWGLWQGDWRVGDMDLTLLDYATRVVGNIDAVSLTHCDIEAARTVVSYGEIDLPVIRDKDVDRQERLTNSLKSMALSSVTSKTVTLDELKELIMETVQAPIIIESLGPNLEDRKLVG